jgi:hypothetical protein
LSFKQVALLSGFSLLAGFIVVPPGSSVNHNATKKTSRQTEIADGMPLPPLPPARASLIEQAA